MQESISVKRLCLTDLSIYQCGTEYCESGHSYGPAVRDHYLVHYVTSGQGFFQSDGKTYCLGKGQGFLICPGKITYYEADHEDPWEYYWVGFSGTKAEAYLNQAGLCFETPVFSYDADDYIEKCFNEMIECKKLIHGREIKLLGILYFMLAQLVEKKGSSGFPGKTGNKREFYINKAIEFIEMNYSGRLSITELASSVGIDRSYLCAVFKDCLKVSPQEYLISYRVNKACELMGNPDLSIGDISRSVGYDDPLLFSKVFKKVMGQSPKKYRNRGVKK